jgi:alkanesulfonate monooxygenase SsuD/methylene tetrahydromethanopterin reductase-like flavin-dependent oxidoreductase (luciferase family)
MAETLDRLSGGRLVLGLGVGGFDHEFAAFGLAQRTAGQKVTALGEAVTIIRGLWTQDSVSYDGEHFHVTGARIEPRPAHQIPIWLGTYGARAPVDRSACGRLAAVLPAARPGRRAGDARRRRGQRDRSRTRPGRCHLRLQCRRDL